MFFSNRVYFYVIISMFKYHLFVCQAVEGTSQSCLLPILSNTIVSNSSHLVKDVVNITASVVFYNNNDWSSSLTALEKCCAIELLDFRCYFRGLLYFCVIQLFLFFIFDSFILKTQKDFNIVQCNSKMLVCFTMFLKSSFHN